LKESCFVVIGWAFALVGVIIHAQVEWGFYLPQEKLLPINIFKEGVFLDLGDSDTFSWVLEKHSLEQVSGLT
jgi:hypothetical protein